MSEKDLKKIKDFYKDILPSDVNNQIEKDLRDYKELVNDLEEDNENIKKEIISYSNLNKYLTKEAFITFITT